MYVCPICKRGLSICPHYLQKPDGPSNDEDEDRMRMRMKMKM